MISPIITRFGYFFLEGQRQEIILSIVQSGQNSFMAVLIACKNEEDPIKNEGARVATRLHVNFSDIPGHSIGNVGIWQKFEFIRAFMKVLITCKNKEDSGFKLAQNFREK